MLRSTEDIHDRQFARLAGCGAVAEVGALQSRDQRGSATVIEQAAEIRTLHGDAADRSIRQHADRFSVGRTLPHDVAEFVRRSARGDNAALHDDTGTDIAQIRRHAECLAGVAVESAGVTGHRATAERILHLTLLLGRENGVCRPAFIAASNASSSRWTGSAASDRDAAPSDCWSRQQRAGRETQQLAPPDQIATIAASLSRYPTPSPDAATVGQTAGVAVPDLRRTQ